MRMQNRSFMKEGSVGREGGREGRKEWEGDAREEGEGKKDGNIERRVERKGSKFRWLNSSPPPTQENIFTKNLRIDLIF